MGSVPALIIALTMASETPPVDRPVRPAVVVMAVVGTGMLTVGLMFEITGRAGSDPIAPVPEWGAHAQANTLGGFALMGAGLCLVTIAALLTPWRLPPLAVWPTAGGAMVGIGARLP